MATAHASPNMSLARCDDGFPRRHRVAPDCLGEAWRSVLDVATAVATIIAAVLAWRANVETK